MPEKDTIFSSMIKYVGVFSFRDFYQFCHDWLTEETELDISEEKYEEKIKGETKDVIVKWEGTRKVTDYFKFIIKIEFVIRRLSNIEIVQDGIKIKTNQGDIKIKVKGILARDYQGKFETTAHKKFMRGIYEKWVIPSRIEEFEDKIAGDCDEFLNQAKAYLDLEGKK